MIDFFVIFFCSVCWERVFICLRGWCVSWWRVRCFLFVFWMDLRCWCWGFWDRMVIVCWVCWLGWGLGWLVWVCCFWVWCLCRRSWLCWLCVGCCSWCVVFGRSFDWRWDDCERCCYFLGWGCCCWVGCSLCWVLRRWSVVFSWSWFDSWCWGLLECFWGVCGCWVCWSLIGFWCYWWDWDGRGFGCVWIWWFVCWCRLLESCLGRVVVCCERWCFCVCWNCFCCVLGFWWSCCWWSICCLGGLWFFCWGWSWLCWYFWVVLCYWCWVVCCLRYCWVLVVEMIL